MHAKAEGRAADEEIVKKEVTGQSRYICRQDHGRISRHTWGAPHYSPVGKWQSRGGERKKMHAGNKYFQQRRVLPVVIALGDCKNKQDK